MMTRLWRALLACWPIRESEFRREMRRYRAEAVRQRRASIRAQRDDRRRHDALTEVWRGGRL